MPLSTRSPSFLMTGTKKEKRCSATVTTALSTCTRSRSSMIEATLLRYLCLTTAGAYMGVELSADMSTTRQATGSNKLYRALMQWRANSGANGLSSAESSTTKQVD